MGEKRKILRSKRNEEVQLCNSYSQLMSLEFILDFLRSLGHLMETVILKGLQAETSVRDQDNVRKKKD